MSVFPTLAAHDDAVLAGLDPLADGPFPGAGDELADLAAYRRAVRRARTRRLLTGAAGLAVLALAWQAAAMIISDQVFLPSVTETARTFVHYLNQPYPAAQG